MLIAAPAKSRVGKGPRHVATDTVTPRADRPTRQPIELDPCTARRRFEPVTAKTPLVARTRRTAQLLRALVPRELRLRYRQSVLDIAWAVITPMVTLGVYGLVLTQSFSVQGGCAPYVTSAWTGMVLWVFFAGAVGSGVVSYVSSADLISKVYFPREALPLSVTGAALADLGVGVGTVLIVMAVQGVRPGWHAALAVFPLLLIVLWSATLSVLTAALAAFVRDFVHAVNLLIRVGFFAVPVLYEADYLPRQLAWTARVNPISVAITETRNTLLCNTGLSTRLLGVHLLVGVLALVGSIAYTRSVESRFVDVL